MTKPWTEQIHCKRSFPTTLWDKEVLKASLFSKRYHLHFLNVRSQPDIYEDPLSRRACAWALPEYSKVPVQESSLKWASLKFCSAWVLAQLFSWLPRMTLCKINISDWFMRQSYCCLQQYFQYNTFSVCSNKAHNRVFPGVQSTTDRAPFLFFQGNFCFLLIWNILEQNLTLSELQLKQGVGAAHFSTVPLEIKAINTKIAENPQMWVAAAGVHQGEDVAFEELRQRRSAAVTIHHIVVPLNLLLPLAAPIFQCCYSKSPWQWP